MADLSSLAKKMIKSLNDLFPADTLTKKAAGKLMDKLFKMSASARDKYITEYLLRNGVPKDTLKPIFMKTKARFLKEVYPTMIAINNRMKDIDWEALAKLDKQVLEELKKKK